MNQDHLRPLNLLELDIEELERRLELAHPVFHPDGYKCGVDCTMYGDCGGHTSPLPN